MGKKFKTALPIGNIGTCVTILLLRVETILHYNNNDSSNNKDIDNDIDNDNNNCNNNNHNNFNNINNITR